MKRRLCQEELKTVACLSMLADHIGAILFPRVMLLRIIGRISFPIYCFLLAEGVAHTRNHMRYGLRLALATVIAEIPFDLAFSGGWDMMKQNVMLTLLLGFLALEAMRYTENFLLKLLISLPFAWAAGKLKTDYGAMGVMLTVMFGLFRGVPQASLAEGFGMLPIYWMMNSRKIPVLGVKVPIEFFAVISLIPIILYSGRKTTRSGWVQLGFYLFYPVHLLILFGIKFFIL